jgi:hypothetical protein
MLTLLVFLVRDHLPVRCSSENCSQIVPLAVMFLNVPRAAQPQMHGDRCQSLRQPMVFRRRVHVPENYSIDIVTPVDPTVHGFEFLNL